jgi:hypothetical protein
MTLPADRLAYMRQHAAESKKLGIVIVSIVFPIIAYFSVAVRVASRRLGNVRLALDDWCVLASLVPITALSVLILSATILYNYGKHSIYVTDHRMARIVWPHPP